MARFAPIILALFAAFMVLFMMYGVGNPVF